MIIPLARAVEMMKRTAVQYNHGAYIADRRAVALASVHRTTP